MINLISISIMLSLLFTFGCAKKNEFQAPPAPEVGVQQPVQKTVTTYDEFPGRLEAHDQVEIRARVKGFLKSIDFDDGQRVKKGDLLFTIEPEQYEASVKSAKARLQQAEASLKLANATLKRNQQAYETKAVAELDLLSAEAEMQSAEASVGEAKAALDNAELDLSYTKILAPLDGRMGKRSLSVGNLVGDSGSTLLSLLVVESPIDAYFNVDERYFLPYLDKGVRKDVQAANVPPVKLQLANSAIHEHEGTIDYIDPEVDPDTGTLRARATFKNQDLKLIPGLYGKILIPEIIENAILVPDLAVQRDMSGTYVLVVTAENKVESRYVQRGTLVDNMRIIESGLSADERIITEGVQRARPGLTVRVVDAQKKESAAPAAE